MKCLNKLLSYWKRRNWIKKTFSSTYQLPCMAAPPLWVCDSIGEWEAHFKAYDPVRLKTQYITVYKCQYQVSLYPNLMNARHKHILDNMKRLHWGPEAGSGNCFRPFSFQKAPSEKHPIKVSFHLGNHFMRLNKGSASSAVGRECVLLGLFIAAQTESP